MRRSTPLINVDTDTVVETIHEEAKTEEKENENGEQRKIVEVSPAKDRIKDRKASGSIKRYQPSLDKDVRTNAPTKNTKQFYRKVFYGLQRTIVLDPL